MAQQTRRKTFAIQKGGNGKTTGTVQVAAGLARLNHSVLVIDLDEQVNTSKWLGVLDDGRDLLAILAGDDVDLKQIARPTKIAGVELIPAGDLLEGIDGRMAGEQFSFPQLNLTNALSTVDGQWDYVIMDTPPGLGFCTVSAIAAAHDVIIPVKVSVMDEDGVAKLMRTVERIRLGMKMNPVVQAIVPCQYDSRNNLSKDVTESLRARWGDVVTDTVIRIDVRLAEAPGAQEAIFTYDPKCRAAEDYTALIAELQKREHADSGR